jgi:hypothetical protein
MRTGAMRVLVCVALLACSAAAAAQDAGCRTAHGGWFRGLDALVLWQAREDCRGSTLLWVSSGGRDGVDDLLIIDNLHRPQRLSLLAPAPVACTARGGEAALVFAVGEWRAQAAPGEPQPAARAWRVQPGSGKVEALPVQDVRCARP